MQAGGLLRRLMLAATCTGFLLGCSGYEAVDSKNSSDSPSLAQREDSRRDYLSAEHLNQMGELASRLRKLSSWNSEAEVVFENLYIQALLFSTKAEAASCEELLRLNPHMPSGRYSLLINGQRSTWNCEVRGDSITSSSPVSQPSTSGLCVFSGTCLQPSDSLMSENYDSSRQGDGTNELLTGTNGRDKLLGGGGNDRISGGGDSDHIDGEAGNDELHGDGGEDRIFGGPGQDRMYGGNDNDLLEGGIGSDQLFGDSGHDLLKGGAGLDLLVGGDGNDYLIGGPDRDILVGEKGSDRLEGGDGHDDLHGGDDSDYLLGGDGADLMYGNSGDDRLEGNQGPDRLHGGDGADVLFGNQGVDILDGGIGDDYLAGNEDDDLLHGGEGNDTLIGHSGSDVYVFNPGFGTDVILEFEASKDRIDIRTLNVKSLTELRSKITCYGRWTRNVDTSNDYCVLNFGSNNKIAILQSPGISAALADFGNLDGIFIYKMSSEEKADREFLVRIYDKYFGRAPQIQAYYFWLEQMKLKSDLEIERDILFGAAELDRAHVLENTYDVALKFLADNNFEAPAWLTEGTTEVIASLNQIYQKYFERDVLQSGIDYWRVHARNMTVEQLEAAIINGSQGADRARLAGYHIVKARAFLRAHNFPLGEWLTEAKEQERKNYVARVFQDYFGRTPDQEGLKYWNGQMTVNQWTEVERLIIINAHLEDRNRLLGSETRKNAAILFFDRNHFEAPDWLIPAYTQADKARFIHGVYRKYFNRDADTAGLNHYLTQLTNKTKEPQVEASIILGAKNQDLAYMAGYKAVEARGFLLARQISVMPVLTESSWTRRSDDVRSDYQHWFGRSPNDEGLKYWNGQKAIMEWDKAEAHMIMAAHVDDRARITASQQKVNQAKTLLTRYSFHIPSWLTFNSPAPTYTEQDKARFINGVYKKYFNRDADSAGLNYYLGQMTGKEKEIQVEANIINGAQSNELARMAGYHSAEARNFLTANGFAVKTVLSASAWTSRSDYVKKLYQKYFARVPDNDGLNYWNGQMAVKEWDKAGADMILSAHTGDRSTITSSEYRVSEAKKLLAKYNYPVPSWLKYVAPGPSYTDADKNRYIHGVFQKYFNRSADADGLIYWRNQLVSKEREMVVQRSILHSAQGPDQTTVRTQRVIVALEWLKSNGQAIPQYLADYNRINSMYLKYFGRNGDQAGLTYWVGQASSRGVYNTVERDVIYNCGAEDKRVMTDPTHPKYQSTYKVNAVRFLNSQGYSVPDWLK